MLIHSISLFPTFALENIDYTLKEQEILGQDTSIDTSPHRNNIENVSEDSITENTTTTIKDTLDEDGFIEDVGSNTLTDNKYEENSEQDIKQSYLENKDNEYKESTNTSEKNRCDSSRTNLSSDVTLKSLGFVLENIKLTESFKPEKKEYTAILSGAQTTFRFLPNQSIYCVEVNDPNATMDIYLNDDLILSNITKTPDSKFTLVKGVSNFLKIIVTAENGDKDTYTVNFVRESFDDTSLKTLDFLYGNPELTEKFEPSKKDYVALVKNNLTQINLHYVPGHCISVRDTYATMDIYFNDDLVLEDITTTPLQSFVLNKGTTNTMKIVVTAESGKQSAYNITFKREGSSDTTLKHIGFYPGNAELVETLDKNKRDYTVMVKGSQNNIKFSKSTNYNIRPSDPYALIDVYLNEELIFENVEYTPDSNFTLKKGITNTMRVVVKAENGDQDFYNITFKREGYSDSSLRSLGFLWGNPELTEVFDPDKKDYVAIVKGTQTTIRFHPSPGNYVEARDSFATMNIYLNDDLIYENVSYTDDKTFSLNRDKANILKIEVTAESGDKSIYTVTLEREGYNDTALSNLGFLWGNPELTETFEPDKKNYTALVKGNQNSLRMFHAGDNVIKVRDPYATMDIYFNNELILSDITIAPDKTLNLIKGITNVMEIVVTAQNGDKDTYTVTFERELDSNVNIKEFSIEKGSLELENDTYTAIMNSWQDVSISNLKLEDSWANYSLLLNNEREIKLNEKFDLGIGNNKLEIKVTSNNGKEKIYLVILERKDNINPTVSHEANNKELTDENVTIEITAFDENNIRYIEMPSGEKVYSNYASFEAEQNGEYIFKIYDNFLNETVKTITISNIDKELPTLELRPSTTDLTNESVDIIIDTYDNVGIKHIETPNGDLITESSFRYQVHEDGTYKFKVTDLAGNEIEKSITLNNIDSVSPILATELSKEDWSNEELTLSVFAMSDKGIKYIELPDGTKVEDNFAKYGINENGTYFIATESLGGNITSEKIVISNIDTELPILILSPSTEDWTNEDVDIVINAEDNIGIDYIILPNGQKVHESKYSYPIDTNGTYEFAAFDLAGNKITQNIEIKNIDKNPPAIENYDNLISILSNIITLDLSAVKTPSGIHKVILPNKEEVVEPEDNIIKYEIKYNDTYTFTVVDKAGNSVDVDIKVDSLTDREDSTNSNTLNDKGHMPDTSGINEIVVIISLISAMAGLMILKNRRRQRSA